VVWVERERKTSALFLDLLDKLLATYPQAQVVGFIESAIANAALIATVVVVHSPQVRLARLGAVD
jgi:hypothetical protein